MNSDNPTPRVNFSTMERYINQRVKLVCKVDQVGVGELRVTTPDNAQVTVQTAPNQGAYDTLYVEVEGIVVGPTIIREEEHTNFDMNLYNEMIKLASSSYGSLFRA